MCCIQTCISPSVAASLIELILVLEMVPEKQKLKSKFSELVLGFLELVLWLDIKAGVTLFPVIMRTLEVHSVMWQKSYSTLTVGCV